MLWHFRKAHYVHISKVEDKAVVGRGVESKDLSVSHRYRWHLLAACSRRASSVVK